MLRLAIDADTFYRSGGVAGGAVAEDAGRKLVPHDAALEAQVAQTRHRFLQAADLGHHRGGGPNTRSPISYAGPG